MTDNHSKLAIGLLLLVGVWISVYWLWEPSDARISFGKSRTNDGSVTDQGGVEMAELPPVSEPRDKPSTVQGEGAGVHASERLGESKPAQNPKPKSLAREVPPVGTDGRPIAVMPPEFTDYTVKQGDTLAVISQRVYGTRAHAVAIGKANPFMDPNRMKPGRVIRVPKDPTNVQGRPIPKGEEPGSLEGARTYTVQSGDTLSAIAEQFYGSSALGNTIFEANKGKLKSPDQLKVGMQLVIPARDKQGSTGENADASRDGGGGGR